MPPPFNIIPTPKSVYYLLKWGFHKLCGRTSRTKKEIMKTVRNLQFYVCANTTTVRSYEMTQKKPDMLLVLQYFR